MRFFHPTWYADGSPLVVYMTIHNARGDATITGYEDDTGRHDGVPQTALYESVPTLLLRAEEYAYHNWEEPDNDDL